VKQYTTRGIVDLSSLRDGDFLNNWSKLESPSILPQEESIPSGTPYAPYPRFIPCRSYMTKIPQESQIYTNLILYPVFQKFSRKNFSTIKGFSP